MIFTVKGQRSWRLSISLSPGANAQNVSFVFFFTVAVWSLSKLFAFHLPKDTVAHILLEPNRFTQCYKVINSLVK